MSTLLLGSLFYNVVDNGLCMEIIVVAFLISLDKN